MATKESPNKAQIAAAVSNVRKARLASMWQSISVRQLKSVQGKQVRGPLWISRVTFPAAEDSDLLRLITDSISCLGNGGDGHENYSLPPITHVSAEWAGWRVGVSAKEAEPTISEGEKYRALMKDVSSPLTILYLFGGNFYTGSPASYRGVASKLAKATHGKVLTVGYRLAPQHPFPAALLDILIAYLSLLYPPGDSYHEPINPSNVVLAGDSAGASLCLSLIQVILAARKKQKTEKPTVLFYGRPVELLMPSGLALLNLAPDQTASLPSWSANAHSDIFEDTLPALDPKFPSCELWPAKPPRGNLYCEVSMLNHPLVSPLVAQSWVGSPPMWIALGGGERLADGAKFLAQNAARQGVVVVWEEYEAMPHLWPLLFTDWPQTQRCWSHWVRACTSFAEGAPVSSSGSRLEVESLRSVEVDVFALTDLSIDDVQDYMRNHQKNAKPFTGEKKKSML